MTADPARCSFSALGTTAVVLVGSHGPLVAARHAVEAELAAIDAACSRFREDSDLTRANRAAGRPEVVGPVLIEAVATAVRTAKQTDGLVDPTIGRAVRFAGYDRDFATIPAARRSHRITVRHVPGWRQVIVDRAAGTVTVPVGVELDLGATAKAYAADRAATAAYDACQAGVLVSLGGDVAIAGPPPDGGWHVGIADDHRTLPAAADQTVGVYSGGLATSSTGVRRWRIGTQTAHHLIDPRTGRPAISPWRTVSVAAGSCVDANAASTAAIIRGTSALDWLAGLGLPARLVSERGEIVRVGDWPAMDVAA